MEDDKWRKKRKDPAEKPWKIGEVRVFSNPGPDAQERLRRLLALMVRYAAKDGWIASDRDSSTEGGSGREK